MVVRVDMTPERNDSALIEQSLDRPDAFAVLFDRHFDAVHRYARRRLVPELADEIASETFTTAFDRRRKYDRTRPDARPWLLGIAANLLRRHWQTERRRIAAHQLEGYLHGATPSAEPEGDVVAALDELSPGERDVLLLYALADLTYEEIAQALEVPVGTVRSRLARARRRLQRRLASTIPNPEGVC